MLGGDELHRPPVVALILGLADIKSARNYNVWRCVSVMGGVCI